jgi:putative CocE/NonD family hydrolase
LKGVDNGVTEMPRVQYFVMGKNEWKSADSWPVEGTTYRKYFLDSNEGANSRFGDGMLTMAQAAGSGADGFVYDPATPVPTWGGNVCCTGLETGAGGYDQSAIEVRNDVLVYTSPPLDEGIEVTGNIEVVLYVSSDARDTDFTAKLVDVYPDGRAFNIQEGAMRMRYRDDLRQKAWMEEGEVYEINLDLHATSNWFGEGHRIRLEVSSSNFPRWSRNMNTGGNNYDESEGVPARNSVYHSAAFPSHLLLPVAPQ